jgi:hypothetical protein
MEMTNHANLNKGNYLQCLFNNFQIYTVVSRIIIQEMDQPNWQRWPIPIEIRYSDSYQTKKKLSEYRTNIATGLRISD